MRDPVTTIGTAESRGWNGFLSLPGIA
jgi:hypothetical protein